MRASDGWCASARIPPAVMLLPITCEKYPLRTATLEAPNPTPETCALASLPIPTPPPPSCVWHLAPVWSGGFEVGGVVSFVLAEIATGLLVNVADGSGLEPCTVGLCHDRYESLLHSPATTSRETTYEAQVLKHNIVNGIVISPSENNQCLQVSKICLHGVHVLSIERLVVNLAGPRVQVELPSLAQQRKRILHPNAKIGIWLGDCVVTPILIEPRVLLHDELARTLGLYRGNAVGEGIDEAHLSSFDALG
ncbi:unnamed protein product [Periconia digitata]|uniref:Uncharacterized protein n=1 Tax=Periconia digitata TaxID=1303443 RepID=A0A9W4UXW4_9PLEO|nr:unnamed protein product [Periconia digitata]